jgi:RNA polymerase sigma factor for flagellar operon FliA
MGAIAIEERAERTLSRADYDRYLPLVRRTAIRLARRVPSYIRVADLVGYGWVGLLEAFEHASPEMTESEFEAYAMYRIQGAVFDYLKDLDPAIRTARRHSRDLARAISELGYELRRPPKEGEIAERLSLTLDDYRAMLERLGRAGMARLEVLDVDELELDPTAELTDEPPPTRPDICRALAAAIDFLPRRLQQLLAFHYTDGRTLDEIGQIYDMDEARIFQLHTEAIHRLRAAIGRV